MTSDHKTPSQNTSPSHEPLYFDIGLIAERFEKTGYTLWPTQKAMLFTISAYLDHIWSHSKQRSQVDPLLLALGTQSGASTVHKAIKEVYTDNILSVTLSRKTAQVMGLDYGHWHTGLSLTANAMANKVVIFDGPKDSYPAPILELLMEASRRVVDGPQAIIFLGG